MTASIGLAWNASTAGTYPIASYNIYRGGTKVASSTTTSYTDSGLANSTQYTYNVTAVDNQGNESAQSAPASATTVGGGGGGGGTLPAGVTLRAIDGETMTSSTVMSHNYYSRNGYTYAASGAYNATYPQGWDSINFFPIGSFYMINPGAGQIPDMQTLSINLTLQVTGANTCDMTPIRNAGLYAFLACNNTVQGSGYVEALASSVGAETVAFTQDEPASWASLGANFNPPAGRTVNPAFQTGRFAHVNGTHDYMNQGGGNPPGDMPAPATTVHWTNVLLNVTTGTQPIGFLSHDIYWFSSSINYTNAGPSWGPVYGVSSFSSAGQLACGARYGDTIDVWRNYSTQGGVSKPIFCYIENMNAYGAGNRSIYPYEYNWACWNTIIHGARAIVAFAYNYDNSTVVNGQTMYTQAKTTHGTIKNLAQVITSPFAIGYCSVSPPGYTFPTSNITLTEGMESMAKWYQGGTYTPSSGPLSGIAITNGFYIFANTRYFEGSTTPFPVTATFTINDPSATSVTVLGESRTIPISGAHFTDTFANAWTVHIYQVH